MFCQELDCLVLSLENLSMKPNIATPKNAGEPSFSRYDTRSDLGYGRSSNRFHKPRSMGSAYPYIEDDSLEGDTWEDEESQDSVRSKLDIFLKSDFGSKKGTDPFYFTAGNTKLSDCFFRVDDVLEEVHATGRSMSPVPSMYKGKTRSAVGSSTGGPSLTNRSGLKTGSKKGFSSPPPNLKYYKSENDSDESILNLKDLVAKLEAEIGSFQHYG